MSGTLPPAKPGWVQASTARAELVSAWFKAALHAVYLCLVFAAASILLWREATTHALHVEVGKEVQSALTLHGGDIDLGLALQDALNERLLGVRQIIEVQGLKIVGNEDEAPSVSFKPFGVDVTTDEITRLTDLILARPKPPIVRLELLCDGGTCAEAGAHPASLVMTYEGPSGQRRAAYPLALGTAALRRTVRQAIQSTADIVLEQSEPAIASIWFLNRGSAAVTADQYHADLSRAVGAAITARATEKPSDCVSDTVIGVSLLRRESFAEGVAVERRATKTSGKLCKIHLLTNIVFNLLPPAYCYAATDLRNAARHDIAAAQADLQNLQGGVGPDNVMLRITAVNTYVELLNLLQATGGNAVQNWCNATPASAPGPTGPLAPQLAQLMQGTRKALPDHPTGDPTHGIVSAFWFAMRAGLHADDLEARVALDRQLLAMTRAYEAADPSPRMLEMIEGQVEMDIGNAVIDAFHLAGQTQVKLAESLGAAPSDTVFRKIEILGGVLVEARNGAITAFENAAATHPVPLTDPADIDLLGLLGDADLVAGNPVPAQAAYAKAVDAFADANEAVAQLPTLADILARWASLRIASGACQPNAAPDPVWQAQWTRLGYGAPDICAWQHEAVPPASAAPAPLPSLIAQMHAEMRRCLGPDDPVALKARPLVEQAEIGMHFLACHDGLLARRRFSAAPHSTSSLDAELTKALAGSQ